MPQGFAQNLHREQWTTLFPLSSTQKKFKEHFAISFTKQGWHTVATRQREDWTEWPCLFRKSNFETTIYNE